MKLLVFSLLCLLTDARPNVVGWYVSSGEDNNYPIERIKWDIYTHIHYSTPIVTSNGTASCNSSDYFLKKLTDIAHKNGGKIQWGLGIDNFYSALSNEDIILQNYLNSINKAVTDCNVDGVEIDYEYNDSPLTKWGIVTPERSTRYTMFLANLKKKLGPARVVSVDVGIWGFGEGEWILGVLPWINVTMLNNGDFDFINTMSYHWSRFGDIWAWKKDGFFIDSWGLDPKRVNIGIPYFSEIFWKKTFSEPIWKTFSVKCPNIDPNENVCNDIVFVGKEMNYKIGKWIKDKGFGGAFPWAMNYDTLEYNNSLVEWLYKGLNESL